MQVVLSALAMLAAGMPGLAWAGDTAVRVGDHAGFGRVVFDLPPGAAFETAVAGDRMVITFHGAGLVAQPMTLPRYLVSVQGGQDTATLVMEPGARARSIHLDDRLIVDVAGPPSKAPRAENRPDRVIREGGAASGSMPDGTPIVPIVDRRGVVRAVPAIRTRLAVDRPAAAESAPEPVAVEAPAPSVEKAVAAPAPDPARAQSETALVPVEQAPLAQAPMPVVLRAPPDAGAAAFARGGMGIVVLDRRLPPQPVPDGVVWEQGAASTLVRFPLADGAVLRLARVASGWSAVAVAASDDAGRAVLMPVVSGEATRLLVPRASRVVTVLDPVTGGTLLVGTSLDAGPGVATERRTPGLTLLQSWLGVVVAPASDSVDLRATTGGFVLTGGAPIAAVRTVALTRSFDLPDGDPDTLLNRLRAEQAGAAEAEPRARSRERMGAARSMIALGMGAEAQSLLQLVAADDPQAAADAQLVGLGAVAAVLARRPGEANGLDDQRLDGTDEIAFWRGLRDWQLRPEPGRLGALAQLALSYPQNLRQAIWPDVAEAAVEAGAAVPPELLPPFAKARRLDLGGKVDEALAAYDALVAGPDRWNQVRASWRATELRLAAGQTTPKEAAAALQRDAFNWRGDRHEVALRLRAVDLDAAGSEWRPALTELHDIAASFPDQVDAVRAHKAALLGSLLAAQGAGLSALDTVLLAADFGDAVPDGEAGGVLARLLADKLMALDLPARAIPILQGLMQAAPAGEPRAEFGARLAQLLLDGGVPARAAEALAASAAPDLPPPLAESRGLLDARIKAAQGDLDGAVGLLDTLGTAAADDLRATLLAKNGDWRGSLAALAALAKKEVPAAGPLSDAAQDILVRQASAAAQVPDVAALLVLGRSAARLSGQRRDLFRVLTQAPLAGPGDLKRAGQELTAARVVAQGMQSPGMH